MEKKLPVKGMTDNQHACDLEHLSLHSNKKQHL